MLGLSHSSSFVFNKLLGSFRQNYIFIATDGLVPVAFLLVIFMRLGWISLSRQWPGGVHRPERSIPELAEQG
jgi:hypothetical protein